MNPSFLKEKNKHGHFDMQEMLPRAYYTSNDLNQILSQEKYNSLALAKQLLRKGVLPNSKTVEISILLGYPKPFIHTLYKLGVLPSHEHLTAAISHGHQDIVKYLLRIIEPTEEDLLTSIRFNYKPIIQLLLKQVHPTDKSMYLAIYSGNKSLVKQLIQLGIKPTFSHLEFCQLFHQPEIAEYLETLLIK
jgi:hypothetical protein